MLNQIAEPQSSRIHREGPVPADACLKYVKLECAIHNHLTRNYCIWNQHNWFDTQAFTKHTINIENRLFSLLSL